MSGRRSTNPCSRIPRPFVNVLTKKQFEEMRLIEGAIRIYFDVTREHKTGYGRLTVLYAAGGALEFLYQQLL